MVTMFVGGVVLILDGIIVIFLQEETYGAGVFCSRPNPYRGKAVNCHPYLTFHNKVSH